MNCAVAARVNESGAFEVQIGNLTALLAKIRPAVEATHYTAGERSAKNYGFVDAVARKNVSLTIANIREKSLVLRRPRIQRQHKDCGLDVQPRNGNR